MENDMNTSSAESYITVNDDGIFSVLEIIDGNMMLSYVGFFRYETDRIDTWHIITAEIDLEW